MSSEASLAPVQFSPLNLPRIVYQERPVITSDLLARAYGAETKHIRQNFNNNKRRFSPVKHYFEVSGKELSGLLGVEIFDANKDMMKPHVGGNKVILYTKHGAALHAKMLNTDTAWELYESMVDNYFESMEDVDSYRMAPSVHIPATKEQRKALVEMVRTWVSVAPLGYPAAHKQVNAMVGVASIEEMDLDQVRMAEIWVRDQIRDASQGTTAYITINDLMVVIKAVEEAAARIRGLANQGAPTVLLDTLWNAATKIAQGKLHLT